MTDDVLHHSDTLLQVSKQAFISEQECINTLLPHTEIFQKKSTAIFERAQHYVHNIRNKKTDSGVEGFLQQYGLDSEEGISIMCLAESLLRIPDADTANALIHDKLKDTEWEKYLGQGSSLFVNASTWGMLLTGKITDWGHSEGGVTSIVGKLIGKLGEPVVREALKKAMLILGGQFVLGDTIEHSLKKAHSLEKQGYLFSYDMLGEAACSMAQADAFYESYKNTISVISQSDIKHTELHKRPGISVKLSALHPRYELLHQKNIMKELLPRLKSLIGHAMHHDIAVSIDAEESRRFDLTLLIFQELLSDTAFRDYDGIGFVLQTYQKRALAVLDYLQTLAETHHKRIPLRIVKGAYWDSEIKHAQVLGLEDYPVFTRKSHTDISYLVCAKNALEHPTYFYPQFATHNALTIASILEIAEEKPFEFQRLFGMGETFFDQLVEKRPCRIYAPVGHHKELLPYLIRRILENSANTSFVNLVVDKNEPIGALLSSPIKKAEIREGEPHSDIPPPAEIYKNIRKNSVGFDLGNLYQTTEIQKKIAPFLRQSWNACSIVDGNEKQGSTVRITSPTQIDDDVGKATFAKKRHAQQAIDTAYKAWEHWNNTPVETRAATLEKTADLIEENRWEAIALCIREAGKTLADAIAEVREAADFCRYYAKCARDHFSTPLTLPSTTGENNQLFLHGKGVFVCISPWNFPLAIFTGQITAALAAGNTVIAKPAEQTPLIAHFVVKLMHKAGIPTDALHLLLGEGEKIGNTLVKDKRVSGIAFTGSTETARAINLKLAKREGPIPTLIAETGGQNAMIMDSTTLPEQAVHDVIASAFGSAGQRCSALRVLYVQDDIADTFIKLLDGAVEELMIGDPKNFATDIGPVIDYQAAKALTHHIETMKKKYTLLTSTPLPETLKGYFIAPHIFEIPSIEILSGEVFGPVLHVVRYKANNLNKIIEEINNTGYGLTFGLHSRIEEKAVYLSKKIHAGNHYVNRSMIGAVVGVQPFGGQGLSGTGPKAGGPHYLLRFANERTLTVNTAAVGGNVNLLNQDASPWGTYDI